MTDAPPDSSSRASDAPETRADDAITLVGVRERAPRGPAWTAVLLLSGVLPALGLSRWLARRLLGFQRNAELRFSARGLALTERTELSGRTLSRTRRFIPRENLARVSREVRYAGAGLHVGIAALLLGTYVGTAMVLDGSRASLVSPGLIGWGLAMIALGISVDFVLSTVLDTSRSRCRVIVEPRRGSAFSCGEVDLQLADEALRRLTQAEDDG